LGSYEEHIALAKEKAKMAEVARSMKCYSSMCDLAFKAVEQAVQADLATIGDKGIHLREHLEVAIGLEKDIQENLFSATQIFGTYT
jgi:HEPN domain-containing protein